LLGLPSTGLHTNGYSLARHLFFEKGGYTVNDRVPGLGKLGTALLRTHRSYLRPIRELHTQGMLQGAAHITGGGFPGNLLRQVPKAFGLQVLLGSWPMLPIFPAMQKLGAVSRDEMFRTFNMGIGMVLTVPAAKLRAASAALKKMGEKHYIVGQVVKGPHRVEYL
jgi:phosphoribosylformylglycinamidine cyclo-ligase